MQRFQGKSVYKGIAMGPVVVLKKNDYQVKRARIEDPESEAKRVTEAVEKSQDQLGRLYDKAVKEVGEASAAIFEVHQMMLEDEDYLEAIQNMIQTEQVNAEYAVAVTGDNFAEMFAAMDDDYMKARSADIRDISERLVRNLSGQEDTDLSSIEPSVIVADDLSPSETVQMDKDKILAFVTVHGSTNSHTAILAKSMDIPCVTGVGIPASEEEWEDTVAIIDGYTGTLYLEPDREVRREYEIRRKADIVEREALLKLKDEKDITLDGKEVGIYANIGSLDDLNSALYYGARGIGLLRSEFQYLGRESYPGEEELFQAYKKTAQTMGDRLVVIRTADLGADKQAAYLEIPQETNPLMGNRGIRFCLDRKNLFKTQIRAIYRASWYGNLGMMYPMISEEEEMDAIEELIREVKAELSSEGILFKNIRTGIMMETPAAVMIGEELARRVDFLGIGTNDLTQYTLAMDRQNPLLQKKYNDHHPAVVRMIKMIIDAGHKENCKVCLCGELAADTRLTETFLRMGVDALSVVPACILPVRKALRAARVKNEDE